MLVGKQCKTHTAFALSFLKNAQEAWKESFITISAPIGVVPISVCQTPSFS